MTLRNKMFQEMNDKKIFTQAMNYAFDYIDKVFDRNVFPSDKAINNLDEFTEDLPDFSGNSFSILKQLHQYGSPATVSQVGGRYFGLHKRSVQFGMELKENSFNTLNDIVFNQVLVKCETDVLTNKALQYIQESGECWVGGAIWDEKAVIRISVCSWATTKEDITRSVHAFVTARDKAVLEC